MIEVVVTVKQISCFHVTVFYLIMNQIIFPLIRTSIDLSEIEKEKTHMIIKELEDGAGTIKLLLTISGTQGAETITDLVNYTTNTKERDDLYRSYVRDPNMCCLKANIYEISSHYP